MMRCVWKTDICIFLRTNIYMALVWRLLLIFFLYSLMRILFYLLNYGMFGPIPFDSLWIMLKGGTRFDASAIFYINIPVILLHIIPFRFIYGQVYQKVVKYIFYFFNAIGIIANMTDVVYYRFTLKRTTMSVFREFDHENPFGFVHFVWDYWYITILTIALIGLMVFIYGKIQVHKPRKKFPWYVYYPVSIALMLIVVYVSVGAMRGGFRHSTRPITLSNASAYISKPEHRAIVLNTPFSIMQTTGDKTIERKHYFSDEEARAFFSPEQLANTDSTACFTRFKERNVVVIIWESLAKEWVGALNKDIAGYQGYTPFIDSLIQQSYVFANAYANGRKSIDAIPSVISSIPALEIPFVLSEYSGNHINSIASLLKEAGYYSAFFHGAPNGSMGFDAFVKQAGFDAYFGMTEYGMSKDYDGHWGIWDEPFLQFMASELDHFPQPFLASVFTVTSHEPYAMPPGTEGKFPKGTLPLHQCIGYTDNAMRLFFEKASKSSWFENTLFVITGDHAVNGSLPEYKTPAGAFAVPMILYAPHSSFHAFDDSTVVAQDDVLPTVLSLVGYDRPFIAFGNNMLDKSAPHFAVNYFDGAFQFFQDDFMLQFTNDKTTGLFDIKKDRLLNDNLLNEYPDKQIEMENVLKSFVQQFTERMLDNNLQVP